MPSPLKISCYSCSQKLDVSDLPAFSRIRCPTCQSRIIVPKPFGNLLLEEDLGQGTLGQVYRAMDIMLDREVAVKVLRSDLASQGDTPRHFINEARVASAINHPNVIPIYSCGERDGQPYIVMQFMEGGSLARQLQLASAPLKEREVTQWLLDMVKGMETAYRHGVLHHNLKPGNVFLDSEGNLKVGDFGLSQVLYLDRPLLPEPGSTEAPPQVPLSMAWYVSPERISTGRQDIAGDLYSLGALGYHLLVGRPPFTPDEPVANLRARFDGLPPAPRGLRPDLSVEMDALLMRLLAIYPSERPRDYAELIEILTTHGKRLAKAAGDDGRRRPPLPKATPGGPGASPAKAEPAAGKLSFDPKLVEMARAQAKRRARRRWLWRLIPLAIIAVTLVLSYAHVRQVDWRWYRDYVAPRLPQTAAVRPPPAP